jgi:hypothetical protein
LSVALGRVWRYLAPLSLALVGFALCFAGLRLVRPGTVFYYTEGPVLGSLAALEAAGDLSELYPADGWVEPPVVLTLYPPVYFLSAWAADRVLGSSGTFLGLRLVSSLALAGLLALLALHSFRRRAPPAWSLALTAAVLLTPAVYRLAGAAQADPAALLLTWVGITVVLDPRGPALRRGAVPLLVSGAAFFLAFFAKQSFVAAPAAVVVALLLEGRARPALLFASVLAGSALVGVFALDALTNGGYLANTVGALAGGAGWANLVSSLGETAPLQWLPILAVVLFTVRGRRRLEFTEIYVLASALLHTAAMLKTGSSSNYFLEPTFALLLLALVRAPQATGRHAPALALGMGLVLLVPALDAARRQVPILWAVASTGEARVAEFDGLPLVDVWFFPAVLERGGRPWLNDPFAFGALQETGRWDPARLVDDLERQRVPFALTAVDLGPRPAPPGMGSRELVFAYFWRSRPIWSALTEAYEPVSEGPFTAWLPRR